jgi:hypothetical protein
MRARYPLWPIIGRYDATTSAAYDDWRPQPRPTCLFAHNQDPKWTLGFLRQSGISVYRDKL